MLFLGGLILFARVVSAAWKSEELLNPIQKTTVTAFVLVIFLVLNGIGLRYLSTKIPLLILDQSQLDPIPPPPPMDSEAIATPVPKEHKAAFNNTSGSAPAVSNKPDISAKIVNPADICLVYENQSDVTAHSPGSMILLWNLDAGGPNNPALLQSPSMSHNGEYIGPHSRSMPWLIFPPTQLKPKLGDRLFGIFTATCPDCKDNKEYLLYFVVGKGGWYGQCEEHRHPSLNDMNRKIRDIAQRTDLHLDTIIPKDKRIPVKEDDF